MGFLGSILNGALGALVIIIFKDGMEPLQEFHSNAEIGLMMVFFNA